MMRALYFEKGKLTYRTDCAAPARGPQEALVRVLRAGICATDLEIVKGYSGFQGIPGHEFVGIVEEADDAQLVGRRVVGSINASCRKCRICLGHGPEHCPHRTVLGIVGRNGAFADYLTLPFDNLYGVPDILSDSEAVFVEPLAAALRIYDQVAVRPEARIAVVGPGRLGLLVGQVLSLTGADVVMLGRGKASLESAEELGLRCDVVTDAPDNGFDFVVEATGNAQGFSESLRLVRPLGTLILKSTFAGHDKMDLTKIVVAEIKVIGSRCGPFAPALRLLADGGIRVREMITAEYSLADGVEAFEHAARPGVKKVLLRP